MFKTRTVQGTVETPNVKSLSDKFEELVELNKQISTVNEKLSSDNEYFRQKQEEFDRKNRGIVQKIKDYWKGE